MNVIIIIGLVVILGVVFWRKSNQNATKKTESTSPVAAGGSTNGGVDATDKNILIKPTDN
jgi:hypothetical protein